MKKTNRLFASILILFLSLSLACSLSGGKKEPTAAATEAKPGTSVSGEKPLSTATAPSQATAEPTEKPASQVKLGDIQRNEEGGFAFRTVPNYSLELAGGMAEMLAPGASSETGPVISIMAYETSPTTNEEVIAQFQGDDSVKIGESVPVTVNSIPGLLVDLEANAGGVEMQGQVVVVMITPTRQFLMVAGAPKDQWQELQPIFAAVMDSVEFFEPQASTPSLGIPQGWYVYSNANAVRDVTVYKGVAYAATLGGMVGWNLSSGYSMKYTTLDGMTHISSYSVTICDIPETRLIVGTLNGLSLYDPNTGLWDNRQITPDNSKLSGNRISALYCDQANNRLLIGYFGLGILDLNTGDFQRITKDQGLSWNAITDIAVSGKDIWVASGYNGISKISGDQITVYNEAGGMPSEKASAVAFDKNGALWIGTTKGLIKYSGGAWTLYTSDTTPGMISPIVDIETAADGTLWLVSAPFGVGKLVQFDPKSERCLASFDEASGKYILTLALDESGAPVYGTDGGVYRLNGGSFTPFILQSEQLATNFVDSFANDPSGFLWVGTDGGLHRLDPSNPDAAWETFKMGGENSPGGNWAKVILPLSDGTVWVVNWNGTLSRYRGGNWTVFKDYYSYDAIAVDDQGRIWLGDDSKSITVIDDDGNVLMTFSEAEGLPAADVRALLADGSVIWIGTSKGLAKYENGQMQTVLTKDTAGVLSPYIHKLALMADGSLLLGTLPGIMRFDGSQVTALLKNSDQGVNGSLTEIYVDQSGRIWAGTSGGLLYSDNGTAWVKLTTADGLPTNNITALIVDSYGTAWIGGGDSINGGGILRIVP